MGGVSQGQEQEVAAEGEALGLQEVLQAPPWLAEEGRLLVAQLGLRGVEWRLREVGVAGAAVPRARSPHCHQSHSPRRSLHQTPPLYHSGQRLAWAPSPQKFHLGV